MSDPFILQLPVLKLAYCQMSLLLDIMAWLTAAIVFAMWKWL